MSRVKNGEEFIQKAQAIHKGKYNYTKVNYVNTKTKVCIICPEHGEFEQIPNSHLSGHGCPLCGVQERSKAQSSNTKEFAIKANKVHKWRYNYSKVKYNTAHQKVCIICPEHGEFWQTPNNHLRGKGCPRCGTTERVKMQKSTREEFISKAKKVHGDRYYYSKVAYHNNSTNVCIICPENGEFWQTPANHLSGKGCVKCTCCYSKPENEIFDFVKSICSDAEQNNRTILNGLELDIFIPSKKLAIEYDGLYWHSEACGKNEKYHLNKTEECERQGIQLIHIFEDEWIYKQEIVKSYLNHFLGVTKMVVEANECVVNKVELHATESFLEANHIQGVCKADYSYGIYHNDELVSLMIFGKTGETDVYELLRFCTKLNTNVVGAAGKLLKSFLKDLKPSEVISYADKRWSQGTQHKRLGFEFAGNTSPQCFYVNGQQRLFEGSEASSEKPTNKAVYKIYDCGTIKYRLLL